LIIEIFALPQWDGFRATANKLGQTFPERDPTGHIGYGFIDLEAATKAIMGIQLPHAMTEMIILKNFVPNIQSTKYFVMS
jgi:hypothetical protein